MNYLIGSIPKTGVSVRFPTEKKVENTMQSIYMTSLYSQSLLFSAPRFLLELELKFSLSL